MTARVQYNINVDINIMMKGFKMTPPKITLQYKCRRCGEKFYDPTITYLQTVGQIQRTPALITMIHRCNDTDLEDNSKRFGICDLIGCKVEEHK